MIVNLKKLVMPASAYSYPLKLSKTLEWVELTGEGHNYSLDGVILAHWFDGNEALVYCPKGRTEPFTVPDGVAVLPKHGFVSRHIDDPPYQTAGFGIVGNSLTLQRHGQFIDERCVHIFGLRCVETSLPHPLTYRNQTRH